MGGLKSEIREYVEALVIAVVLALFIITFIAQSFLVQGSSMVPTLHDGERLLVDKLTWRFREPKRGEIVVFRYPSDPRRKFIKRIIGVPGDQVLIKQGYVYVNGERLEETYINGPTFGAIYRDTMPVQIPEGHYYVLGDNRTNSDDSRFDDVGLVPRELLVGRALLRYWPLAEIGILQIPRVLTELE
ncbi:MAG: signal peptidase I [Firmicutes bacterium]|nr:signal peptidase I [Bacillota bacterium]